MAEWFEGFFGGLYTHVLAAQDETKSRQQARLVKRLLGARRGQRVLDIPCGMGRLTIPMAKMGLAMTGVDLVPAYIRRAGRAARRERTQVRFIRGDMRHIDFHEEFDAAFNWFTSFGYFSDAGNLAFLRRVLAALKPGGRFLVDVVNISFILAHSCPRSDETIAGVRVRMSARWDGRARRMRNTWTFSKGEVTERHRFSLRMFTGTELRGLLRRAGFREIRLYGRPPLGRFTRHSRRLVAVARKPGKGVGSLFL